MSSVGTVVLFFDVLYYAATDYQPAISFTNVQDLFCPEAPPVGIGTPACAAFLAILERHTSLAGAYYNDQLTPSAWVPSAHHNRTTSYASVTVAIPFSVYAEGEVFIGAALLKAMASVVPACSAARIVDFQETPDWDTQVQIVVTSPDCKVASLFQDCGKDACDANDALAQALTEQGVRATVRG